MASITSSNTSLPASWLSESTNTSLRDASFSSYLNSSEESYIRTLVQTSQNPGRAKQQNDPLFNSRTKVVEDGEIDVFSADKYFKGEIVHQRETKSARSSLQVKRNHDEKVVSSLSKLKLQPRTPSVYSESSMNSQSALLRPAKRNPSRGSSNSSVAGNLQGKKSFLSSCYCCDKKSVDIENRGFYNQGNKGFDDLYETVVPRPIKTSLDTGEKTRLNKMKKMQQSSVKKIQLQYEEDEEMRRKKSLEVFGSNETKDEGRKRFSLEKRLNLLSWDAIPTNSGPPTESYNDTESDASSDLFEIECLSNPVMQEGVARPSDGCATPTTAYAPSEVSVDWSVVTASAADFSIVSDSDEQRSVLTSVSRRRMVAPRHPTPSVNMTVNKEVQKARSVGLLTGCKTQKAVRVAGNRYRSDTGKGKSSDSQKAYRFSDSYSHQIKFQADQSKLPGHVLRQPKTISSSDLLYIH